MRTLLFERHDLDARYPEKRNLLLKRDKCERARPEMQEM
jgi:hypothetical protein